MAAIAFPTMAYNATAAPQLVQNQAALTALGASWVLTPFATPGTIAPTDPNLTDTDIRLQQMLVEQRMTNLLLQIGLNIADDPMTHLRPDILANDIALTS